MVHHKSSINRGLAVLALAVTFVTLSCARETRGPSSIASLESGSVPAAGASVLTHSELIAAPSAYSLSNVNFLGWEIDPRYQSFASFTLGDGQFTTDSTGTHLFTELSGKPFVDGELPEWDDLLWSTDQLGEADSSGGRMGSASLIVQSSLAPAPAFNSFAQSACTNSTVFFNGYYYTYFEAYEQPLAGLYILGVFVGRSLTPGGNRQIFVGNDSNGNPIWQSSPASSPWVPVVRSYFTANYQIAGGARATNPNPLGTVQWNEVPSNGIWSAGMPNAVVVNGQINLYYLDPSYALSQPSGYPAFQAQSINNNGATCTVPLTPSSYLNQAQQSCTCTVNGTRIQAGQPGCTYTPPATPDYTFVVRSTNPTSFNYLSGATMLTSSQTSTPLWYNGYWGGSVNIRFVDDTGDFVQMAYTQATGNPALSIVRSSDGVTWTQQPAQAPPVLNLSGLPSAYHLGQSQLQGVVMGGDDQNHLQLANSITFGLQSFETLASGNFSMGYESSRMFGFQGQLGTVYAGTPPESWPSGGPTDSAQDFNPNLAMAMESYQSGQDFTVCGSDLDSPQNVWAEAFWTNPNGQTGVSNPPIYSGTQSLPQFQIVQGSTIMNSPRMCLRLSLGSSVTLLEEGWKLTLRFHQNVKGNVFSVPVVASAQFYHSTPQNAPLGASTITAAASINQAGGVKICGTGLYSARTGVYGLLQWIPPGGSPESPLYYLPTNPPPNPEPTQAPSASQLNAGNPYQLYRYIDAGTRLQCVALPLAANYAALLSYGWQAVVGVGDPASGQEIRIPLQ